MRVRCHDAATWRFPTFAGQLACSEVDFHFWDAVDDLSRVNMTLVFDEQRMYMHNASGMFGSIPLTLTGGLQLSMCTLHCLPAIGDTDHQSTGFARTG